MQTKGNGWKAKDESVCALYFYTSSSSSIDVVSWSSRTLFLLMVRPSHHSLSLPFHTDFPFDQIAASLQQQQQFNSSSLPYCFDFLGLTCPWLTFISYKCSNTWMKLGLSNGNYGPWSRCSIEGQSCVQCGRHWSELEQYCTFGFFFGCHFLSSLLLRYLIQFMAGWLAGWMDDNGNIYT